MVILYVQIEIWFGEIRKRWVGEKYVDCSE